MNVQVDESYVLTTESAASSYGMPVLRHVPSGQDFGPCDVLPDGQEAGLFVAGAAFGSEDGDLLDAARRFLRQFPDLCRLFARDTAPAAKDRTFACPACGFLVSGPRDGARFCQHCGEALPALGEGEKVRLLVYAEHATRAGCRCWDESMEDSQDVVVHEGTAAELLEQANMLERNADAQGAGTDVYHRRVARVLRDACS